MEIISCVLVLRNKHWFNKINEQIKDTWSIIEKERVDGYEHRAAKKRAVPKINTTTGFNPGLLINPSFYNGIVTSEL